MPPRNLNYTYEVTLPWANSFILVQKENPWPVPSQGLVFHSDCWILHQSVLNQDAACPSLVFCSILLSPSFLFNPLLPRSLVRQLKTEGERRANRRLKSFRCSPVRSSYRAKPQFSPHLCSASDLVEWHPELLKLSKSDASARARSHTKILAWVLLITGWTWMWWRLLSVLS